MSRFFRLFILIVLLLVAVGVLVMQFIHVPQETALQPEYTSNSGELTGTTLVGQTFVAPRDNLSGIAVQFATYSDRKNTAPIELHVRNWPGTADIRTVKINPDQLKDNRLYNFVFDAIPNSANKTFFFYVVSPQSIPGNAVTVDIDNRDPYTAGTAFIAHDSPVNLTQQSIIDSAGKSNVDVTFTLYHQVPLRVALLNQVRQFSNVWADPLWIWAAGMAVCFLILILLAQPSVYARLEIWFGSKRLVILLLILLFSAALGLRIRYAQSLPFTSDEGGYLYDAHVLLNGHLAGGDGYVKSPLVIGWVALWQFIVGNTLLAGRLSSIVISSLTIFPLYWIGTALWHKRVGLVIAGAWAFLGTALVSGIYVHTQPLALFFGISGLALIIAALREVIPRNVLFFVDRASVTQGALFWGGVLLGLGVASRKSILALGLVPLLACLIYGKTWWQRIKYIFTVGLGFTCVMAAFLVCAYLLYGQVGIREAIGLNSAEDGINANDPSQAQQVLEYSIRGMTPFFRESLPVIMLTVIGLGISLERLLRSLMRFLKREPSKAVLLWIDQILPKLAWIAAFMGLWWAWRFFNEYEGSAFMRFGIPWLWYSFAGLAVVGLLVPRPAKQSLQFDKKEENLFPFSTQPGFVSPLIQPKKDETPPWYAWVKQDALAALVIPAWVGGLVFLYIHWIKFHANYISEFIPPLIILTSFGAYTLWRRLGEIPKALGWIVRIILAVAIVYAATVSNYITYLFEHTGQFDQKASVEAAQWAKEHIPFDQSIFTGAALIPYLSGHHVTLDIAHPRWYAYEFTRNDPQRLNTFLPPAEDMVKAFRTSEWFLMDQQTGFSFIMEYSEIEKALQTDFAVQTVIDNGGNPLTFYKRIHAAQ